MYFLVGRAKGERLTERQGFGRAAEQGADAPAPSGRKAGWLRFGSVSGWRRATLEAALVHG